MTASLRLRVAMAVECVDVATLARMARISHHTVRNLLDGDGMAHWRTIERLAIVLDVSPAWLADGVHPPAWLVAMLERPQPARIA